MLVAHQARLLTSAPDASGFPDSNLFEVVLVGKSNVGKSTLINALTRRKRLAYVGQTPGKTRMANFYQINDELMLVDVPGYGFANRTKEEQIAYGYLMEAYFSERTQLKAMLVLADSRRGLSKDDLEMIELGKYHKLAIAVILTKVDKISNNQRINLIRQIKKDTNIVAYPFTNQDMSMVLSIAEVIEQWLLQDKFVK